MDKIEKGDLVEIRYSIYNRVDSPKYITKVIVKGTEKDPWCIKNHIDVKGSIIPISDVISIIKKQVIPKELFHYLQGSLYLTEAPGHRFHDPSIVIKFAEKEA